MADIGTLWFNMEFTGNWQQDLDKMAAQFKKLQKEIEEGQKKVNERASMTNAYKTLLREQQKIENQVRRTASLQKGEYVKSIDMGTMATKTQLEAWQRLGDEMKRLEQLAASKGKKIVVNDSELTKARNLTNELSQQQRIENEIAAATRKTTEAKRQGLVVSQKQSRILRDLHSMALSYASVYGATRLLKSLYKITGEFEMQKVAMGAILNDVEAADKLFRQLQDLAVKSPFQFMDLATFSKQLSAFSIPTKELYDTTKMLADVSAGLGVSMERLILAYGQIRAAAVLRGQEIRQLTEAGIPVLFELQKQFEKLGYAGITVADIFDKVSARLVPFEMIKEMFEGMTREGGKFYQMQEIQAQTLKGKMANLKDAYQIAIYEIGEANSGVLKWSVDLIRKLIDSYEKVGNALGVLIKTYGVYRAAVMIIKIGDIALQYGSLANAIRQSATAQQFLNKTMLNNPYVLAIAGITAVISVLIAMNKEAREFKNNLNDIMSREKASSQKLVDGLSDIREKLESSTQGTQKYRDAVDELNRVYGEYLPALATEATALDLVRDRQDEITNAIYRTARARAEEKAVADAYERFSNEKETANLIKEIKKRIPRLQGGETIPEREVEKQVQDLVRLYAAEIKKQTGKFSAKELFNKVYKGYYQTSEGFFSSEGGADFFADWATQWVRPNHALNKFTDNVTGLMNALNQISVAGDIMADGIGASNVEIRKMLEYVDWWEANELALLEDSLKAGKITVEEYKAEVEKLGNVKLDKLRDGYLELGMAEKAAEVGLKSLTERTALWKEMAEGIMRGDDALLAIMPLQSGDSEDRNSYFKRVEDEYSKAEETIKRYSNTIDENAQIEVAAAKKRIDAIKEYFTKYGYYSETVFGKKNGVENTDDDDEKTEKKIKNLKKEADFIKKLADAYSNLLGMVDEATAKDILQTLFPDVTTDFNSQLTAIINQLKEIGGEKALDAAEKIALIFSEDKIKAAIEMGKAFKNFSEIINEWEDENFDLFGTGTLFDVSKIVSDFENAIVKLNDKQKNAIDELKKKRLDANSDEYRRSIEKINSLYDAEKNAIRAIHQERINKLANAFVSDSLVESGYRDAIQNMSNLTVEQLKFLQNKILELSKVEILKLEQDTLDRLSEAKLILDDMSSEDLSDFLGSDIGQSIDETQKKILELIVKLKEGGISMGEFGAAVKKAFEGKSIDIGFEEIKKNAQAISQISKSISSAFSSIADMLGLDSELSAPIKDIVDQTGILVENFYTLAANSGLFKKIGDLAGDAAESVKEINEAVVATGESVKEVGGSVASTGAGIAGAIIAIVGAVIQIGGAVAQVVQSIKQARLDKYFKDVSDRLDGLKAKLDGLMKVSGLGDGWFTEDNFQKIRNLNSQINEVVKNLRDVQEAFKEAGKARKKSGLTVYLGNMEISFDNKLSPDFFAFRDLLGELESVFDFPRNMEAFDPALFRHFDLGRLQELKTELQELRFIAEDANYEALRDNLVSQIDLILESYENIKETIRGMVGDISGNMLSAVNTMWDEMRQKGIDTFGGIEGAAAHMAESLKKDVSEVIDQLVSQQLWATYMGQYFDQLGEKLTVAIIGGGDTSSILGVFDDFWANMQSGLVDYTSAYEMFLQSAERHDWSMGGEKTQDPAKDSIKAMRDAISKLKSEYEELSAVQREGEEGEALLLQIKELEKALAKVEDAAAAAEANINKLLEGTTDRRKQIELLLTYARGVEDQKEREIALQKRQNLLAEEYADLYSQYVPDAQAYEDELDKMNEDILWAIENGYPELAEWIQQAFDTTVLEKWREEYDKALEGEDLLGKIAIYDEMLADLMKQMNEAANDANYVLLAQLKELYQDILGEKDDYVSDIKDDWRQMYITDEEKYLDRVKKFQEAIGEAVSIGDYEAAKRLERALNDFKLDEWKSNVGDVLDDIESIPEKLSYIDEQIAGLDRVKDAEKILHFEELRADLLDEMNQKYETEEEAHARKIKALEAELAYYEAIGDEVHARVVAEEVAAEVSAENARILGEQFEKEFADLDNMASMTTIKMLEEWKDMIEQREDLSKEEKEKLLGMANDAIDEIVNNVEDKFQKVSTIISDISGLLTAIGADSGFIEVLNGIGSAVGELGNVVTSLMYGNIFGTISGLIRLMSSIVTIFKQAESRRMEEMLSGIALEVENLERAASRAFGANATAMNLQLIRQYEHAIALARQQVLKMEDAKNPDREQIANIKAQIRGWEDAIYSLRETMSQDFFQDDFRNLSSTLIGVVAQYKDNLTEMTRQLNLTVDEMIKNLIHNYMSIRFLQDPIHEMMEDIFSTYTGSGKFDIPISKLNNLRNWIATTVPQLGEMMNDLYESLNISDMNFEGTANAIKSITESQANSLIGYMQNVMQGVHRGNNISESMLEYMRTSAANNANYLLSFAILAQNVQRIANNTDALAPIRSDIRDIRDNLRINRASL